jgi:two-component system cell cycle response regulator
MSESPKPPPSSGPGSKPKEKFKATVATDHSYGQTTSTKAAYVTVIAGGNAGEVHKLESQETFLGRSPEATLRIESEGVSMRHARLFRSGPLYLLEDQKSTNGTAVNDKRITMTQLHDGDRIQLGPSVFIRFNLWDDLEAGVQIGLYESAVRDPLTRAYNRKHFNERLTGEIAYAARNETPLSLIMSDIDFFKRVNDTYGHPGGDAVLKAVAAAFSAAVRQEDVFARIGGEEFVVLARGIELHDAVVFAERLRMVVQALQIPWGDTHLAVTSSFGVAALSEVAGNRGDGLIALADQRLYAAKHGGRNRAVAIVDLHEGPSAPEAAAPLRAAR